MTALDDVLAAMIGQWQELPRHAIPRYDMPYRVHDPVRRTLAAGREVYPFLGPAGLYLIRGKPIRSDGTVIRESPAGGVYAIRCREAGRVYIGSTWFFNRRWSDHLSALRRGTHKNRWLQRDWQRLGGDAFTFEVRLRLDWRAGRQELCGSEQLEIEMSRASGQPYNVAEAYAWLSDVHGDWQ